MTLNMTNVPKIANALARDVLMIFATSRKIKFVAK